MGDPIRVATATDSTSAPATVGTINSTTTSTARSSSEPGLYTYAAVKGHPFGINYFNLKLFHESGNYPELQEEVQKLDEYIVQKAKQRGLEDSDKSYKEIVDEILKKIGKSPNEEAFKTFKRVSSAVQAMERLKEAKLPVNLDLENLTSKEIEDISGD